MAQRKPASNRLRLLMVILVLLSLAILITAGYFLLQPSTLPYRQVTVIADADHVTVDKLQQIIKANLQGGFFSLKVAKLKQALSRLAWIKAISLQRVWPSTLVIVIDEQYSAARWNNQALLNQNAQLFYPEANSIPKNLPELFGPKQSAADVLNYYKIFSNELMPLNFQITNLSLDQTGAWSMQLNNGLEIRLGSAEVLARFTRFTNVYPRLARQHKHPAIYIDLRYPDGFAVKWGS
ncbi:MAG: cell division protein FtsQ/DivIB [Gammaproteobacteria bacterium]|nr:cell division protein FtsQ/DivIB [Gammaproteobacteria bacterium]